MGCLLADFSRLYIADEISHSSCVKEGKRHNEGLFWNIYLCWLTVIWHAHSDEASLEGVMPTELSSRKEHWTAHDMEVALMIIQCIFVDAWASWFFLQQVWQGQHWPGCATWLVVLLVYHSMYNSGPGSSIFVRCVWAWLFRIPPTSYNYSNLAKTCFVVPKSNTWVVLYLLYIYVHII